MGDNATRFFLPSYAKINLGLQITGKRPDGYHELETAFQQISLKDDLHFAICPSEENGIDLTVRQLGGVELQGDNENLVYRAAELFLSHISSRLKIEIVLEKRIPIGAGLGGGSSNAAVTLLGLNAALDNPLTEKELVILATKLGADVPFFIYGGLCSAAGIGDVLEPISKQFSFDIVILCPDISISTKWAYENIKIDLTKCIKNIKLSKFICENKPPAWRDRLVNDFEPLVFQKYKQLLKLKEQLYRSGSEYASLTGSGSTVFGIFSDRTKAEQACSMLRSPLQYFIVKPMYWGMRELVI